MSISTVAGDALAIFRLYEMARTKKLPVDPMMCSIQDANGQAVSYLTLRKDALEQFSKEDTIWRLGVFHERNQ